MSPDLHRQANTVAVLRALAGNGPASVAGLRQATGLSRPTLDAIVADLLADDLIVQRRPDRSPAEPSGRDRRGAGRPARLFAINPDAGFVAGVDVGRHKILVIIADLTGAVRAERRATVPARAGEGRLLGLVQDTLTEAVGDLPVTVDRLRGITVGVPGVVHEGRITRSVVVPQWSGTDVGAELADWSGVGVTIDNDANLALSAEHWRGAAADCRDVTYILAGRRTRAAIMINGTVLTGRHGEAGEIGSVPELFFDTPQILLGDADADSARIAEMFAAARDGDRASRRRVDRFCAELARTLRFLITVLDPEMVVIGGGLSGAGDQIITGVGAHLEPPQRRTPLVASGLGDTAVALGAVRRAQLIAAADDPLTQAVIDP